MDETAYQYNNPSMTNTSAYMKRYEEFVTEDQMKLYEKKLENQKTANLKDMYLPSKRREGFHGTVELLQVEEDKEKEKKVSRLRRAKAKVEENEGEAKE